MYRWHGINTRGKGWVWQGSKWSGNGKGIVHDKPTKARTGNGCHNQYNIMLAGKVNVGK